MDRKGTKYNCTHSSRKRKRFHGNDSETEAEFAGTSAKKLHSREDALITHTTHGYRFVNFIPVFAAISQMVICRKCKKDVRFSETDSRGLGFKITLTCNCGVKTVDSCPKVNRAFEINHRVVMVMRLLGVSREGLNLFCGFMDLCQGLSTNIYNAALRNLHAASSSVFDFLTKKAVEEEKEENVTRKTPPLDLTVFGDGSWEKRGFNSLFGVTTLIGKHTGKVIDLIVKSSSCQACKLAKKYMNRDELEIWSEDHEDECPADRCASAGEMQVEAMKDMFGRSVERYGVRYTTYVGDGDWRTHQAILDMQPYGKNVVVTKSVDIGYVHKRMGSRLRCLKENARFKKGELTVHLINKLSNYYGLAVRKHRDSVESMKNAIYATLKHLCSTDEEPQHDLCPAGAESWCRYRRAEAAGLLHTFVHDPSLSAKVVKLLKPIYADLTKDNLLERYLGGGSQNSNERFNATIWRLAPKHLHCGFRTLETAAFLAACLFNEGCSAILRIMCILGIVIGPQCNQYAEFRDRQRKHCENSRSEGFQKVRAATKVDMLYLYRAPGYHSLKRMTSSEVERETANEFFEIEEDFVYGPGTVDS